MKALHLTGSDLTLEDLKEVVCERRTVLLAPDARRTVERARGVVDDLIENDRVAYGVTTGVGKLSDVHIAPEQVRELQVNLLRSHAVGVGEPLPEPEVRAMMLLRANSLAKGFSGVRAEVIDKLCELLDRGVHPMIPCQGSVGASGDLAPLAHLALVLIGEGEAFIARKARRSADPPFRRVSGAQALKLADVKPIVLEAKEAISLINGTQAMLALGALAVLAAETLADSADVIGALTLDSLCGSIRAFDPRIHQVRPHAGQAITAEHLTRMISGSQILESHKNCGRVQDAYSLRCMPQVHGAVRDTIAYCRGICEVEMNSAVDNPLVFVAKDGSGEIISGGNFHGEPLAFALDFLGIALSSLAGISERRIDRLVNPFLSEGLPPFLAAGAGLNSGFMMAQVTAAALASENKVLAHPASVDSITTSGNKEDYVSMGMSAALKLMRILRNTTNVLAIEAAAAAQALDFKLPLKTSKRAQRAYDAIRAVCPSAHKDRVMAGEFERIAGIITSGKLADVLR